MRGGDRFESAALYRLPGKCATGTRFAASRPAYRPNRVDDRFLAYDRFEPLNVNSDPIVRTEVSHRSGGNDRSIQRYCEVAGDSASDAVA